MTRKFAAAVCLLLLAVSARAEKRAFTIEDLYRLRSISDLRVSPDGRLIIYSVSTPNLGKGKRVAHIWMMHSDGSAARQLTFSEKGESSPAFSPDGNWISFVSSREGSSNLYLMPVSGGEAHRLTKISTGVSDAIWSPDGKWLAFSSDVYPECGADDACNKKISDQWSNGPLKAHMADSLLYRHWTSWKDGTRTHVLVASTDSGDVRDLTPGDFDSPPFGLGGPISYDFSPDSSEIALASNHDSDQASSVNADIWLLSLRDKAARARNITAANKGFDSSPRYSPDGRYIAYRTQATPAYESALFRLAVFDRKSGTSSIVSGSFNDWIDDLDWTADSKALFFTAPVQGINPIFRLDVASMAVTRVLDDRTIDEFTFSRDDRTMFYVRRSVGEPAEIYRADLGSGVKKRLSSINQSLADEVDIRPAESMWVEGAGGAKIQFFIVKPHNFDPNKKYPLILNVHGGPQSQWSDALRGDWQVYPGAGYVVAFANPHGSTGYGQEFTAQISGDWGGQVYEDLMKVTDALEKLPYVDRDRMGAMGWSYGGYMMNWFEGHTTRFKAIASMMGLYNLTSFYGATEELWFPEWDLKGQPWNSDLYQKWSPSNFVKNFKTPCLVITGERDYRVPYTQGLEMFTALQKMNVPSKLLVFSEAGHWPGWYEMVLYYTAHLEWFHKYLGGGAPPWSTEQFLRNGVFDAATGERTKADKKSEDGSMKPTEAKSQPDQKAPRATKGKPAQKPVTP